MVSYGDKSIVEHDQKEDTEAKHHQTVEVKCPLSHTTIDQWMFSLWHHHLLLCLLSGGLVNSCKVRFGDRTPTFVKQGKEGHAFLYFLEASLLSWVQVFPSRVDGNPASLDLGCLLRPSGASIIYFFSSAYNLLALLCTAFPPCLMPSLFTLSAKRVPRVPFIGTNH